MRDYRARRLISVRSRLCIAVGTVPRRIDNPRQTAGSLAIRGGD